MATPSVAAPKARGGAGRIVLRILLVLPALIVVTTAGILIWVSHTAHASLPQLDGTIAVQGLHAPVNVVRDAHGVPHISAASLEDLFFAQRYVTAQDRPRRPDRTRRKA